MTSSRTDQILTLKAPLMNIEYSKIFKKYLEKIEKHFNMFDTNINIGVHRPRFVTSRTDQILTKVVGGGSWPPHIAPKY